MNAEELFEIFDRYDSHEILNTGKIVQVIHWHELKHIVEEIVKNRSIPNIIQWVGCKEELPKEDGDYLINWDGSVIEAGYYVEENLWHDYTVNEYKNVTHWMYLPKPPQIINP